MLYITAYDNKNRSEIYTWSVGKDHPLKGCGLRVINTFHHIEVCADGEELKYIRTNMSGLPDCSHRRYVAWYGDHARFILHNLATS